MYRLLAPLRLDCCTSERSRNWVQGKILAPILRKASELVLGVLAPELVVFTA
jgi:hypothetical protein